MLIFWKIRYLHRSDKQFHDRDLLLDTSSLSPANKAAVELLTESGTARNNRVILKFRSLFTEASADDWTDEKLHGVDEMRSVFLEDYFEDENGKEVTMAEMGPILTGDPDSIFLRSPTEPYNIEYLLADKPPVPLAEITLSTDNIRLFGYFVRDLDELLNSALMKDGPGTISYVGSLQTMPNNDYYHQTAVTDDEIRSFMTIFRRLYMENEPANFVKSAALFETTIGTHPLGKWVKGVAVEYKAHLVSLPESRPFLQGTKINFNTKRLIDVFLYTQYAHQPDEIRQRQFTQCLHQVGGRQNFLVWLFLKEVRLCGIEIGNAGRVIAQWFNRYCEKHSINPDVLKSIKAVHTGLGTAEKGEVREARLFGEKLDALERELWRQAGEPMGGPRQFRTLAQQQLMKALQSGGVD